MERGGFQLRVFLYIPPSAYYSIDVKVGWVTVVRACFFIPTENGMVHRAL